MRFTSYSFLLLSAVLLILYYTLFRRCQWPLLLIASMLYVLSGGTGALICLLFITAVTYSAGRILGFLQASFPRKDVKRRSRICLLLYLAAVFGILALCKGRVAFHDALLPLGVSFYTFQSVGYVLDVHRGGVKPEKNIGKLALFASYFPQLVQGPISQFSHLEPQLFSCHAYDGKQVSFGLQRMLWGYFKKLVIADRIAVAVAVLKGPEYTGLSFFLLTLFYAVQIYADFTGGIDIALGLSEAFGIRLPENFIRPFFSKSIAEYWRRWHITLGQWMKTYVFYPLCVSAPMRKLSKAARQKWGGFGKRVPVYIASVITWICTGIWHGLTPNFLLWGIMNCAVILLSEELQPLYARFHTRFRLKEKPWYSAFGTMRLFLMMNFIRAIDLFPDVGEYFRRLGGLFSSFRVPIAELGLTAVDYGILAAGILLMLTLSGIQEKAGSIRQLLWERTALRYTLTIALFLVTLLMGSYGIGYEAGSFIYNQF